MSIQREIFRRLWISFSLTLLIFLIDLHIPLILAIPVFYATVIVLMARQYRTGPLLLVACVCSALTLFRVISDSGIGLPPFTWESRFLALFIIWMTAFSCLIRHTHLKNNLQVRLRSVFQNSFLAGSLQDCRELSVWINQQFRTTFGSLDQVPVSATCNAGSQTNFPLLMNTVSNQEFEWLGEKNLKINIQKKTAELTRINESLRLKVLERKQSEHKLQTAYKRTQDILDSLFVFVGVYSLEGILLEVNRAPLDAAKLRKSDVIGKPFWQSYRWSYSAEVQAQMQEAFQRAALGETVRYNTMTRLSKQKTMDLDMTFGPLSDAEGNIVEIVLSAVDITDRLDAERSVAKKTAQLQAIQEANPDLFIHLSTDGTIVGYESGKNKSLFLPPEELLNKKIHEILPRHVVDQFEAAILELNQTNKAASFEYTLKVDQQTRWFQARLFPYLSDEFLVIIQDINEQKTAQIEMKNMHNRLFEAQRLAHIGSWEWDIEDQSLWWSEEVYCIFGLNASQFPPNYEAFLEIIHPDDRELVERVIANTLKNNLPFSIEHRIIRSNGEIRHVHEQAVLKKKHDSETWVMYGTIQDITERHEASRMVQEYRDELAHVSRLSVMGELVTGLSHELNQPLTAIANYSSCMKSILQEGGDVSDLVTKIEAQSLRSGEIVRRMKSLATKQKQQRFLFNIHDSIRSAIQLLQYKIRLQQIQVKLVSENNFTTVYADRVQIEQVLINLIKNAVEALEEISFPRILTITTSMADSMIQISVADTGAGVPETFMDRLFTPFATNKKEGLGIGLSLSRSLINASGGKMWYSSNSKGGATFHISLPSAQTHQTRGLSITKN